MIDPCGIPPSGLEFRDEQLFVLAFLELLLLRARLASRPPQQHVEERETDEERENEQLLEARFHGPASLAAA
jgi:hypothetical protein